MAKVVKPLNNTIIQNAKAKEAKYTLFDGKGLDLEIMPNGGKFWRFRYSHPITKARVQLTLGKYPALLLADARAMRNEYLALIAQNIDPRSYRKQQEAERIAKSTHTLLAVAIQWKAKKSLEVLPKTIHKNWERLEKYLFPTLGAVPIADITPKIAIATLHPLEIRGISDTAQRVRRMLLEIIDFAVNTGIIEFNKCTTIGKYFAPVKSKNNPTIRPEELPVFMERLRDSNLSFQIKALIKWQLLTITRAKEASGALWEEIDFKAKTWTISANRMKMKRAHIIPLSRQCLALLGKMEEITGDSPYVFQSMLKPNQPINSQSANRAIGLLGYKGKLTAHGLRSIASTYLNEQLINYDVIEACLAHTIQDQTRKAYNRTDYLDQRVEVMQQWADFVEECSRGL